MAVKHYRLENTSLINWCGMVQNYKYALQVDDGSFVMLFEGMWGCKEPDGLLDALKNNSYTVDTTGVTIEVTL